MDAKYENISSHIDWFPTFPFLQHLELEGLLYSLPMFRRWWPCIDIDSWFWSKQVYTIQFLLLIPLTIGITNAKLWIADTSKRRYIYIFSYSFLIAHALIVLDEKPKHQPQRGRLFSRRENLHKVLYEYDSNYSSLLMIFVGTLLSCSTSICRTLTNWQSKG